jgi:hypothetical protein
MKKESKISAEMTVLDIISDYPQTEAVFKSYDAKAGECICCQMLFESVESIIEKYRFDREELLEELNNAACS